MVTLKEITKDNYSSFLKMKVKPHQEKMVAPSVWSIAQAHFEKPAWFRGIYFKEEPVGFVMLSIEEEKAEYWIWRFMIADEQQGKGYGKAAVQLVIEHVKTLPKATELYLSYVPKVEGSAEAFYEKLGFTKTGKVDEDGEVEMVIKF